jgi:hypothetical protein
MYQIATKLLYGHEMYQMAVIYSKFPTFSIPRAAKIYPNWDFGFENTPSGSPGWKSAQVQGKKIKLTFVL